MKEGTSLINFARNRIIAVPALLAHLDGSQLSHAVLDFFDPEPLSEDSPLWDHLDITVLSHISAPTYNRQAGLSRTISSPTARQTQSRTPSLSPEAIEYIRSVRWHTRYLTDRRNLQVTYRQSTRLAAI